MIIDLLFLLSYTYTEVFKWNIRHYSFRPTHVPARRL